MFSFLFLVYQLYRQLDLSTYSPPPNSNTATRLADASVLPTFMPTSTPTLIPTPTILPTPIPPTSTPTPEPTHSPLPPPSPTESLQKEITPVVEALPKHVEQNSLTTAVNSYRNGENKQQLQLHTVLCTIADKRLISLIQRSSLDNHEGFQGYQDELKQHFSLWGEVIFFSDPPKSPTAVVTEGWANSSAHKDTLLTQDFTNGCGAENKGFAVFLLGKKK